MVNGKKEKLGRLFGKLMVRESLRNWAQSLTVIAIGAIAVTLFIGLQANAASMEDRVEIMKRESRPADIYLTTDPYDLASNDDSAFLLSKLGPNDYLESRFYAYTTLEAKNAVLAITPGLPTLSKGYEVKVEEVNQNDFFYVDEHVAFEFDRDEPEIPVLGKSVTISFDIEGFGLSSAHLALLDTFLIQGQENPFRAKTLSFESKVTGVMKHPENTAKTVPIPFLASMSNLRFRDGIRTRLEQSFTPSGVELLFRLGFKEILGWGDGNPYGSYYSFPAPNQYLIALEDPSSASAVKKTLVDAYASKPKNDLYLCQTLAETSFMTTLQMEIDQATKLTYVFPVVFFAVGILVILTTVRQTIVKRRSEIGAFKALGLTRREIHAHFLSQTGFSVLLASLIGSAIGPFLIPYIMAKKYDILYTLPERTYLFPFASGLTAIAVFLLISLLVTFLLTRREISLKPVESLRPKAMKTPKSLHASEKERGPLTLSAKIAFRNMAYDPVKALMVFLGVAGCTMLLITGFGIDNTLDYDIATDPYVNSSSDVMAHFVSAKKPGDIELVMNDIQDEDGTPLLSSYQPYDRFSLDVQSAETSYTTYVFVLGPAASLDGTPVPDHLVHDFPKDQIMISGKVADRLRVTAGSELSFYINSEKAEGCIHEVFDAFYGNGIIIHYDAPFLQHRYDTFSTLWANAKPGISQERVKAALLSRSDIPVVETFQEWMDQIRGLVSSIGTMTMAVKIFAALLAAVVLYNLGLLNFRERTREIATLKVLGFRTREIGLSLLIETMLVTLAGIGAGMLVGFPFMTVVLLVNQIEIIHYLYMIYPLTYLFGFLFTFLIALAANVILAMKTRKIEAVTSLKSVE